MNLDALRDEIARVWDVWRAAFDEMWRMNREGTAEEAAAALAAWQATNIELDALIRAGALVTLGPIGEPRDD